MKRQTDAGRATVERSAPSSEVILFAQFRESKSSNSLPSSTDALASRRNELTPTPAKPTPNHRARVLSMELRHLKLCGEKRCDRLRGVGIETAGDLVAAEPLVIAKKMKAPAKAEATLRRYQQAVRLSASVPGLMPRDALLLVAIHRRTTRALAIESPALLYRDIERFALSTRGQRELRGRRLPSIRRVRKWIEASTSLQLTG